MPSFFSRAAPLLLAIDVSSESLHLLEIATSSKQNYQLRNYGEQRLPSGCVLQQKIVDSAAFSQALMQAVKQCKPHNRKVALALPVNQVITKTCTLLSHLTPTEVTKHIQKEILIHAPAPETEVYWDYAYTTHNGATTEVLVVVAQRTSINPFLPAMAASGLSLRTVDVESFALARAWQFCYPGLAHPATLHAVLLLREHLITVVLLRDTQVFYARAWPLTPGNSYDKEMVQGVQQLWRALPMTLDWPPVGQVWLAGECAEAPQVDLLQSALNLPVSMVELPARFFPATAQAPAAAQIFLSLGLALWGKHGT